MKTRWKNSLGSADGSECRFFFQQSEGNSALESRLHTGLWPTNLRVARMNRATPFAFFFYFFFLHVIPVVQQIICRPSNLSFSVRGLPPRSRSTFLTDHTDVCWKTLHALFSLAKGAALCLKCVSRLKSAELCTLRAFCSQMSWFIASNLTLLVGWLVCQQSYTKTT